jgi:hypothetical protein
MRWVHWIIFALLLVFPAVLVTNFVIEFFAVDSALDEGASYDYIVGKADHSKNHPYIPFSQRHGLLTTVSACSLFAAFFFSIYLVIKHRIESSFR